MPQDKGAYLVGMFGSISDACYLLACDFLVEGQAIPPLM